jgi:ABC-2 type transport system permease protein
MRFYLFEIRYWLRQPMVYIFFIINALLIFGATSSDNINVGGSFGNILKNAPFVIQTYYSIMSFLTLLMTTAFILASTIRDFTYNSYQIIFTTPVKRLHYLLGRFFGAVTISTLPMLGVSAGILIGCLMPWVDPEKVGLVFLDAHLAGFLQLAVPNTLFSASVVFIIAALTRNTISAFIGSLLLLVATGIAGAFAEDLSREWLAILMDPYGSQTFSILTKYWTVSQKNSQVLPLTGLYLYNRLIWFAVSVILILITSKLFSFTAKNKKVKEKNDDADEPLLHKHASLPAVSPVFNRKAAFVMYFARIKFELSSILKSPAFIVILIAGLLNFLPTIFLNDAPYGLTAHPVTYYMIDMVQGSFYLFLIAIIIIYSGQLVWKERDNKMEEIYDATPHPTWISWLSKFTSLAIIIFIVQVFCIIACITAQLSKGFYDIRPAVYITTLLGIDYSGLLYLVIMAMFLHSVINNKYLAFFAFVIFLLLNNFLWVLLEVESNMVQYGGKPTYIYSDMNGYGPFLKSIVWFRGYWLLLAVMLAVVSLYSWTRGKETSFRSKSINVFNGIRNEVKPLMLTLLFLWLLVACIVFYNTKVINKIVTEDEIELQQAAYEKKYKKFEKLNQPRITAIKYAIDIFPSTRSFLAKGEWWVKNKGATPIDSVHVNMLRNYNIEFKLPGSALIQNDEKLHYRIYKLHHSLMPGDSLHITFSSEFVSRGFENEVSFTSIADNGSFFNNSDFSPAIGYQPGNELADRDKRKKQDLPEKERLPALERNCTTNCMNNYISNNSDWVTLETTISTSADQTAIAPGSLTNHWKKDGRNYYSYHLDHYALNFYSFMSARYEILRDTFKGIKLEVYYDKSHPYNIQNMRRSLSRSLDYYTSNFGTYSNAQARIIEFPRYQSFAQAFPGTMPYSEGIGFISKIEKKEDIDMVFYVVAHEMAHQYWAHQLIGAEMQGATLLSETFAQYSALMVMEKEYGRNAMKKFLKYEMDNYLRARGSERRKEVPLMYVEDQGYIHYRKGSLVMYYLREMIGEEMVNKSLRKLLTTYAYKEPPYPTAYMAVDAFRENTPDSLQYLITDLFETITLFNNRAKTATAKKQSGNNYELTLEVESQKFRADSLGRETEIPVNDWIEIGVFGEASDENPDGNLLFRQKFKIQQRKSILKIIVNSKPYKAGIDPLNLMVDLVSDDNIIKVE